MSGGFGLPVLNLQNALGALGTAYGDAYDKAQKQTALSALGEKLKAGDYMGGASVAFDAGDPSTGLGLLKLAQADRKDKLGIEATRDLASSFGLGGPQAPANGLDAVSGGRGSGGVPSFLDTTNGPQGDFLTSLFRRESNNNDMAQASTSSARGAGQFTRGTWNQVAAQHPDLGLTPVGNGRDGRTDRAQMVAATRAHTADNEAVLRGSNLPVTDATRYALHFLGAGGGRRLVAGTLNNPDAPALSYANPDQVAANRNVFFNRDGSPKSAGQVMNDFARSFGGGGGQPARQAQGSGLPPGASGLNPDRGRQAAQSGDDDPSALAPQASLGTSPRGNSLSGLFDPRADMPAEGSREAQFVIPPPGPAGFTSLSGNGRPVPGSLPTSSDPGAALGATRAPTDLPSSDPNAHNPVPTLGGGVLSGRTMQIPGQELSAPRAPSVPIAPNTMIGTVPAGAIMAAPTQQRVQVLQRALLNPNLPDHIREFASTMLKQSLDETKMPDAVKEFVWARANGMTTAASPAAYAQEKLRNPGADLTSQVDARSKAAVGYGLQPGTPEYRSYVLTGKEPTDRDEGAKITAAVEARRAAAPGLGLEEGTPAWRAYVGAGKIGADKDLSASDRKAIQDSDGQVLAAQSTIDMLGDAKKLSTKSYAGPWAGKLATITGAFGGEAGQATQELDNLLKTQALGQLKATFGGNPTEGERAIMLEIMGSSSKPEGVRQRIYDRAIGLAQIRLRQNQEKADELRGGTYFRPGGGGEAARQPTGGETRALPAPSLANRPGAASAADRYGQLVGSGLTKQQAYQQLHSEGY